MLAIILGLFASFWFAASMILINRGVLAIDYFRGLLTNLGVNALFLWLYVMLFVESIDLGTPANLIFVLVGIFVPGVARFFMFKGMERLGASITSCLTNSTPLFATFFAISFLFAARDNMVRFGLLHIDSPIVGAAIAASTSFVTMSIIYLAFEKKPPLAKSVARGFGLFAMAGFMNFLSYVFAYTALSMERVSLMSPLINGSSLFILPLSALFLKGVEQLTPRKIGAIGLVIIGVFLISWEKL